MIYQPASPREELRRSCQFLMRPGDVIEVRIPDGGRDGTIAGSFDDPEKLADAVLQYDGKVPGIYATLNPIDPALLARAANRLQVRAKLTTSDVNIPRRRWILIDCDPKRPAGISSTDFEHGRAFSTALGIWDSMRGELGDPAAIADSGNGVHLIYPIDLPNDKKSAAGSTDIVKRLLSTIAVRCAPDDVSIDQTVFNAGRITKLWGTMARKGDSIPVRPHRRSRLLEVAPEL